MESDDDDLYGQDDHNTAEDVQQDGHSAGEVKIKDLEEGEEEGEEVEDEDSDDACSATEGDDDIHFITDSKEAPKPEVSDTRRQPPPALSLNDTRKASATPVSAIKTEQSLDRKSTPSTNEKPGTEYPARHTSTVDPNANPVHPSIGKPILSTDFDADFPTDSSKPWRKPGSDITDYFNYGFDEFTWASYCLKQQQMPKEISEIKAQADFMKSFVEGIPGGGVPGMPGVPTGPSAQGANGTMPGMPGMPNEAEMQQKFMSMMERGIDPSSMNPEQFMQQMMMGGGQGFGGQAQGFGGMQGGGQQQQQPQMGFGAGAGGGGGFDQGGNFGKGRGRGRRGW